MEKIPTAEEFSHHISQGRIGDKGFVNTCMIEFAKMHVKAALKTAALEAHTRDIPYTDDVEVDKASIIKSYPLENIK